MKLKFKKWFSEVATSTGDVAMFARPIGGACRRQFPSTITIKPWEGEIVEKRRRKNKKKG